MGKHSAATSTGSVLDLVKRPRKKSGRHAQEPKRLSAAAVLAPGRRAPVMAAIAVPTVAIATVTVAGMVGAPKGGEVTSSIAEPQLLTVAQPAQPQAGDSKEYADAQKQAKDATKAPKVSAELIAPKPDDTSTSTSSAGGSSTGSSESTSSSSDDAAAGDFSGDYGTPMSTADIKAMLGGPGSRWYNLVKCESNFNPRAVNSSNHAHFGLFQFKIATWQGVGGKGNPADADPREQFKRAKILQAKYGWGQWACA